MTAGTPSVISVPSTLIIDDATVRRTVDMDAAIGQVRLAYKAFASGAITEADRVNLGLPTGFLRLMAASWPERAVAGYKEFHRCNGRVRYTYHLIDQESGDNLAMLDANYLTALRTGACGGLAVDVLAREDARTLGVIGAGGEARTQIAAIRTVRSIERVMVFSPRPASREALADELRRDGIDATAVANPQDAAREADVVAVATNTGQRGPAFEGAWLVRPGAHVNSIGSTLPSQREIDEQTWAQVDRIVVDAALLLNESGDAIAADKAGTLDRNRVTLLGDVIRDGYTRGNDERTLYKSVGSALQDLALAHYVYQAVAGNPAEIPAVAEFRSVAVMST